MMIPQLFLGPRAHRVPSGGAILTCKSHMVLYCGGHQGLQDARERARTFCSPSAARTMADIMFYLSGRRKKNCDQKDCGPVALGETEFIFLACWFLSRSPRPWLWHSTFLCCDLLPPMQQHIPPALAAPFCRDRCPSPALATVAWTK